MSGKALSPGFMVIHGNQPELLRQLLVRWFAQYPLKPLEDEIILVQSNGIAQWLKLALASTAGTHPDAGCGIAAALDMQLPSRFVWQVYRAVLGRQAVPETSPFDKPQLIWRLMRLLPTLSAQAGYAPLTRFLRQDADLRKRYQLAEKIADLFDQYQVYRADWLTAWAQQRDILIDARAETRPLDEDQRWQAHLWRALLADVGEAGQTSRAAVHQRFLDTVGKLAAPPADLPRRVSVFGLSALPRQSLEVLQAISRFSQVILCVHNPCELFWSDLRSTREHARREAGRHRRKADMPEHIAEEDLHQHVQPLLAAWGKQGRDYIALLDEIDQPDSYRATVEAMGERIELFHSHGRSTLLNQLQDDIRLLRSTAETRQEWPPVDTRTDQSIRFHVAHSTQREVEILHDQLLAAFDADPSLRPRDIIVMVPDVDQYAPHIAAVFGQIEVTDARHIPFSIADQTRRHQAPLAFALDFLLRLPESRLGVSELLDLLDVSAVRQRFGIAADDLPLLRRWIEQTHIRWGLSAEHRERLIGQRFDQNSWHFGLRRMLLGYAVGQDASEREALDWHDIEPFGEIGGLDASRLGPLSRLLAEIEKQTEILAEPATPDLWRDRLHTLLQRFFEVESAEDTALLLQMQETLEDWAEACGSAGLHEDLPLNIVREHWLAQVDKPGLAQRFMAGRLTFATLMPMRAIPFRMVCLLGMNDGEFPRLRPPVDFDLMSRDVRPGDRSRREDDRYLFLEALLSARDRLLISWVGRSLHDNSERPPSVLVSQLRDHLAAGWRSADDSAGKNALLSALTVEHRLQPFNPDYFGSTPADSAHFTYAREWEVQESPPEILPAGKSQLTGPASPLPPRPLDQPVSLNQLAAFLRDPVRTFFRERLGIDYAGDSLAADDHEPFAIDGLDQWSLQSQLIQARLDAIQCGASENAAIELQRDRIRRRGELPLGRLGDLAETTLLAPLGRMFDSYHQARSAWPERLDDLAFSQVFTVGGQALTVEGRIGQRHAVGQQTVRIELTASDLLEKKRYRREKLLQAWVSHLAAHVASHPVRSEIIGKNGQLTIRPLPLEEARAHFTTLLEAYLEGLRAPLPFAPKTGFAWLEQGGLVLDGELEQAPPAALKAAQARYQGGYNTPGEVSQSPYLQRQYPVFEQLWSAGRFSQWVERLYRPLLKQVGTTGENA